MSRANILVVEDEAVVAADIQERLVHQNVNVVGWAMSGREAVKQAEAHRPDLILMDIMLRGEMDGIEAAGECRCRFGIPVVYLTAYASDTVIEKAAQTEPYGYLMKPFEDRELKATITVALHRSRRDKQRGVLSAHHHPVHSNVMTLPICSWCKKIRSEDGSWIKLETYFIRHGVQFTHSVCPDCFDGANSSTNN